MSSPALAAGADAKGMATADCTRLRPRRRRAARHPRGPAGVQPGLCGRGVRRGPGPRRRRSGPRRGRDPGRRPPPLEAGVLVEFLAVSDVWLISDAAQEAGVRGFGDADGPAARRPAGRPAPDRDRRHRADDGGGHRARRRRDHRRDAAADRRRGQPADRRGAVRRVRRDHERVRPRRSRLLGRPSDPIEGTPVVAPAPPRRSRGGDRQLVGGQGATGRGAALALPPRPRRRDVAVGRDHDHQRDRDRTARARSASSCTTSPERSPPPRRWSPSASSSGCSPRRCRSAWPSSTPTDGSSTPTGG